MIARFSVNGSTQEVDIAPETRLIEVLHRLGLTAATDAPGCDIVLVDDRLVAAGMTLALVHEGAKIETMEGPAGQVVLGAFSAGGAAGQPETAALVVTALHALRVNPWMTEDEARAAFLGQACPGTGHAPVVSATLVAAEWSRGEVGLMPPIPQSESDPTDQMQAVAKAFGWDDRPRGGTPLDAEGRLRLGCGTVHDTGLAVAVEIVVDRDTGHAALSRLTVAPTPVHTTAIVAALTRAAGRALFAAPDAPHAFTLPDILWAGLTADPDPAAAERALTAAIATAVSDATGIGLTGLPLTSDRILAAMLARDPN